ncbi:LOW QUALITY PROTEIN: hypothetical protein Cgig2_004371 [Carnegiea gigantea]|uniref:Uncharacterized protein n=1 Tax=Carnegiea gigantea TaxID=171969 RepID=A0A9Q1QCW8_9CARY|nr:LOW QUALITY PROTEIN: hypothetical protein Cgig2_004371 [Carnegiea gigantea]
MEPTQTQNPPRSDGQAFLPKFLPENYKDKDNSGSDEKESDEASNDHVDSEGLVSSLEDIFPESRRRICCVHYNKNFTKDHLGMCKTAYVVMDNMQCIQQAGFQVSYGGHKNQKKPINGQVKRKNNCRQASMNGSVKRKSNCGQGKNLKMIPNSSTTPPISYSFNRKTEKFRCTPIFTLLEAVRKTLMSTIAKKFEIANGWSGKLCPRFTFMLKEIEI